MKTSLLFPCKLKQAFVVFILIFNGLALNAQLIINEFQATNKNTLMVSWDYPDWIEIKNNHYSQMNLAGYFLSDDFNNPTKWSFSGGTTIPANGYLVVYASGEDNGYHTNFKLSSFGEQIILSDPDTNILDTISFDEQYIDYSYGRNPSNDWVYFRNPTPNSYNDPSSSFESYIESPKISLGSGIYNEEQVIELTSNIGANIYYTTDGSIPTEIPSNLYSGPISIDENTVLKAIASNSEGISLTVGANYIFNANHSLPVVFMTSANDRSEWVEKKSGKYDMDGRVRFEYIESSGKKVLDQYARFRKSGGVSSNMPQLNGKMRPAFDKESFKYQLFPNKKICDIKGFLIRNASQDNGFAHMRDAIFSRIIGQDEVADNFQFEGYRAVVLYVDGVYEGVVHIREDDDAAFWETNYPGEKVSFKKEYAYHLGTGALDYSNPADRAILDSTVNIHDILTVFHINRLAQAGEWEHWIAGKFENRKPNTVHFIHDVDYGLGIGNYGHIDYYKPAAQTITSNSGIPSNIMNYEPYKQEAAQFSHAFYNFVIDTGRVLSIVDEITNSYKGEMDSTAKVLLNNSNLHPYGFGTPFFTNEEEWLKNVDTLKMNVRISNDGIYEWLKNYYGYGEQINVQLQTSAESHGFIRTHGIKVLGANRNGKFFGNLPLQLEAIPLPGYEFSHWEGDVNGTNPIVNQSFSGDALIRAVFTPKSFTNHNVNINELQAINNETITDEMGEYDDWFEIYNSDGVDVDLAGYYISDDSCNLTKWMIPYGSPSKTTVTAEGWILFWADEDTAQGPNHLPFKLAQSEVLFLTYPDGKTLADSISYSLGADQSIGSEIDGGSTRTVFDEPTPDSSNNALITFQEEINSKELNIYPNPTNNTVEIQGDNLQYPFNLSIINLSGKIEKKYFNLSSSQKIDVSELASGTYFILIESGQKRFQKKLIKVQ